MIRETEKELAAKEIAAAGDYSIKCAGECLDKWRAENPRSDERKRPDSLAYPKGIQYHYGKRDWIPLFLVCRECGWYH